MKSETKLFLIKVVHTLVWIFFNVVIFYMLYAVGVLAANHAIPDELSEQLVVRSEQL